MVKKILAFLLFLGVTFPLSAAADNDTLARFKGGIGVLPVSNVSGTASAPGIFPDVTRNIVRGVNPAGQIWVIADLRADVKTDGSIKVMGKGLLLGGGNSIGGNANASVFATLICQMTPSTFTEHNTDSDQNTPDIQGVPLEPNGDFRIDDKLSPVPVNCASPVLLIRNAANKTWFAAGIPKQDNDD